MLLRGLREKVGFVPNLAAAMSECPTLLRAFLGLRTAANEGVLDAVAREVVAIAVAAESVCSYGAAAHSTFCPEGGCGAGARRGDALGDGAAGRAARGPCPAGAGGLCAPPVIQGKERR
jgi:alkylhydroperoxidase family enzyme